MQSVRDIWHAEAECIKEERREKECSASGYEGECLHAALLNGTTRECLPVHETRGGTARSFAFTPLVLSRVVVYSAVNAR